MEINEIVEKLEIIKQDVIRAWRGRAGLEEEIFALSSAISILKSHQALKKKVSVEKIEEVIKKNAGVLIKKDEVIEGASSVVGYIVDEKKIAQEIHKLITKELTGEG